MRRFFIKFASLSQSALRFFKIKIACIGSGFTYKAIHQPAGQMTTSPKFSIRKHEHFETLPLAYKRRCQCHEESKVLRMVTVPACWYIINSG